MVAAVDWGLVVQDWPADVLSAIRDHPGTAIAIILATASLVWQVLSHVLGGRARKRERAEDRQFAIDQITPSIALNINFTNHLSVSGLQRGHQIQFPAVNAGLVLVSVLGLPKIYVNETNTQIPIAGDKWWQDKEPGARTLDPTDVFLMGLWCRDLAESGKAIGLSGQVELIASITSTLHAIYWSEPFSFDFDADWVVSSLQVLF